MPTQDLRVSCHRFGERLPCRSGGSWPAPLYFLRRPAYTLGAGRCSSLQELAEARRRRVRRGLGFGFVQRPGGERQRPGMDAVLGCVLTISLRRLANDSLFL